MCIITAVITKLCDDIEVVFVLSTKPSVLEGLKRNFHLLTGSQKYSN